MLWSYRWVLAFVAVAAVGALGAMFTDGVMSLFFLVLMGTFLGIGATMIPTAQANAPRGGRPKPGGLVE